MTRAIGETASPIRPFRSLLAAGQQPIRVAVDNAKLQISRQPKERTGQTERDPLRGVSPPSPKERAEREVKPKGDTIGMNWRVTLTLAASAIVTAGTFFFALFGGIPGVIC